MNGLNEMCSTIDQYAMMEMSKERKDINTKELGEVVDMMKDLSEVKKNKAEEKYYCALIDAMEDSQYGVDYDEYGRMGYSSNRMMNRSARRGYEPDMRSMEYSDGRMGYSGNRGGSNNRGRSSSNSRYGYSHDDFMSVKEQYSNSDPQGKAMRMQKLKEYTDDLTESAKELVDGMSPEEKQMWKSKLNNLINM